MIQPIININGTSKDDLVNPRIAALDHINDVIETLKHVTPNGRDYPGDTERLNADRQKHFDRIAYLRTLYNELYEEAIAIKGQ